MFNNVFRDPENVSALRKHQIDTLKVFNDNVAEVVEDSEYRVTFGYGGRELTLNINLGANFPSEKPVIAVSPVLSHPWITPNGEISSAPGLLNFTVHSDLGRVVNAIVRELELKQPPVVEDSVSTTSQVDGPCPETVVGSPNSFNTFSPPSSGAPPSYPELSYNYLTNQPMSTIFPGLNSLPTTELKELLENEDKIDNLIDSLPVKQALNKLVNELIELIVKQAEDNLRLEDVISKLVGVVMEALENLRDAKTEYDVTNLKYQELCEKFNPFTILEKLSESLAVPEEESERIADELLERKISLDTFINDYIEHKKISYSRKIKHEKLSQQLEKLNKLGF